MKNILHITSGELLNDIMKQPNENWVPFNEAMIEGSFKSIPFSENFILERAATHNVSVDEYKQTLSAFLNAWKNISQYDEIDLYFGNEPFCIANTNFLLKTLKIYDYKGTIVLNIVNENTAEILSTNVVTCNYIAHDKFNIKTPMH